MYRDHEFDPVTPEEQARREQEEEFARRVRREVRRMERGEAEEDIRADEEREAEERPKPKNANAASDAAGPAPSGAVLGYDLVREGVSKYYPYMLTIRRDVLFEHHGDVLVAAASTCVTRVSSATCRNSANCSIRLQEQRYQRTTHSAIVEQLRARGIELYDPQAPGEIIEN